jgi:hypothetical protein
MKKTLAAFFLFFAITLACRSPFDKNSEISPFLENVTDDDINGEVIIGNKTEDPHVMRHMEKALKELAKTDVRFQNVVLNPNYKYVKIVPTNDIGVEEIKALNYLHIYHYPLDYEIKKHGQAYNEPEKNSKYQSFWVVVPTTFTFSNNIKEKILEEAFIPFGTGNDTFRYDKETESVYSAIEITANNTLYPKSKKAKVSATYSGTLAVEDDTLSQIRYGLNSAGNYNQKVYLPLKEITIRARNLLTTNSTKTDLNGSFLFSRNWLNAVDEYTIVWESNDFYLATPAGSPPNNLFNAAITSYTSNISNTWVPNFGKASRLSFRYGHVFRGAHNYYNLPSGDIQAPPRAGFIQTICNLSSKVEIRVRDGIQSTTRGINSVGCYSNVVIENSLPTNTGILTDLGYNTQFPSFKGYYLFASISHELTHLKHWAMPGGMTDAKYCLGSGGAGSLAESYALMGEYYLVNKEYSSKLPIPLIWQGDNYDRRLDQNKLITYWQASTSSCSYNTERYYTPYFIDLMDNRNQSLTNGITRPSDQVSGFTAKFLEDCLKASPDNWGVINAKIKAPSVSNPILSTPISALGNNSTDIDYLYNLYKSL